MVHFCCLGMSTCSAPFLEKPIFSALNCFFYLCQNSVEHICRSPISGFLVLLHWSMCLLTDILALLLILGKYAFFYQYVFFCRCFLWSWENSLLFLVYWKVFFFRNQEWVLYFVKRFFLHQLWFFFLYNFSSLACQCSGLYWTSLIPLE